MASMAQREYEDYLDAIHQYQRGVAINKGSLVLRNGQELVVKPNGGVYGINPDTGALNHIGGTERWQDYANMAAQPIDGTDAYFRLRSPGTRTPAQTVTGVEFRSNPNVQLQTRPVGYYDAAGNFYGTEYARLKEYQATVQVPGPMGTTVPQTQTVYDIARYNYPDLPNAPKPLNLTQAQERQAVNGTDAQRQLAEMRGGLIQDVIRGGGPK